MSRTEVTQSKSSLLDEFKEQPARRDSENSTGSGSLNKRTLWVAALLLVSLVLLCYAVFSTISSITNNPARAAFLMTMKDSETGDIFKGISITAEKTLPFTNPKTGKRNLYPVEECYWTKEGKAKLEPTFVILNERMGKTGKTICPDCGRTVTRGNPRPPDQLMQAAWDASQRGK